VALKGVFWRNKGLYWVLLIGEMLVLINMGLVRVMDWRGQKDDLGSEKYCPCSYRL
jgi:hypothetical protein